MTSVGQPEALQTLDAARAAFHEERQRVRRLVGGFSPTALDVRPPPSVTVAIAEQGHFSVYDAEVGWSARLVVGHLGDSARIFADRISRVRTETDPVLADFVTDADARLDRYLAADPTALADELEQAQDSLEVALAGIRPDDLGRTATHEVDGALSLGDIVAFLPEHQRDHADQLSLLAELDRS
jgi:uncharacterized damage-inducible protein DinB